MRRPGWLLFLVVTVGMVGCGPELRPDDTATRSLAPRGSYDKLEPATRGWSGETKVSAAGG